MSPRANCFCMFVIDNSARELLFHKHALGFVQPIDQSNACKLDDVRNDEMRMACHLIVNSLSGFRTHASNIAAAF
jgi:hypothetical protein